jgi:osmotically-inducible protein OsmY
MPDAKGPALLPGFSYCCDVAVRDKLLAHLKAQRWAHTDLLNITVTGGVVDLWGITTSDAEKKAIRVAAESSPAVCAVSLHPEKRKSSCWECFDDLP